MIKFKGAKKLKSKQEDYLRSLSMFVLDKFFTQPKKRSVGNNSNL